MKIFRFTVLIAVSLIVVAIAWDRFFGPLLAGRTFFPSAEENVKEMKIIVGCIQEMRQSAGSYPTNLDQLTNCVGTKVGISAYKMATNYKYFPLKSDAKDFETIILVERLGRYKSRPGGHMATLDGGVIWVSNIPGTTNYDLKMRKLE